MKVEDDIPIPPKGGRRGENGRVACGMKVGQSVLFDSEQQARKLRDACRHAGFRCAQRKVGNGWRVWRIE